MTLGAMVAPDGASISTRASDGAHAGREIRKVAPGVSCHMASQSEKSPANATAWAAMGGCDAASTRAMCCSQPLGGCPNDAAWSDALAADPYTTAVQSVRRRRRVAASGTDACALAPVAAVDVSEGTSNMDEPTTMPVRMASDRWTQAAHCCGGKVRDCKRRRRDRRREKEDKAGARTALRLPVADPPPCFAAATVFRKLLFF
mmetsp:Transcript_8768/g.27973  ORF Transcript_8768/g.27973 Transcript_8768/m.27973 type:complete len:203 (+) Transcript_8768:1299-1907(+)